MWGKKTECEHEFEYIDVKNKVEDYVLIQERLKKCVYCGEEKWVKKEII